MKISNHFGLYFILLLALIFTNCIKAQTDNANMDNTNHQLWIDFYPHFYINDKFEYYGDAGYRTMLQENIWHWVFARPSVRYHPKELIELHGGVGFFYTFNIKNVNRFEIRPWQGFLLKWPTWEKVSFKHYIRMEERVSFLTNNWSMSFSLRMRYKISTNIKLCRTCSEAFWFIPIYAEAFFPINDDVVEFFRNRGRAGVGLGYNANKYWRFSVMLNWQSSRTGPDNEFSVSDYIYQVKIRKLFVN